MKKLLFLTMLVLPLAFLSCGGHSHEHGDHQHESGSSQTESSEAKPHGEGKEYTSAYVCPMHCEGSGSDEPGKCPVCGMDYIAQAEHTKDGHHH